MENKRLDSTRNIDIDFISRYVANIQRTDPSAMRGSSKYDLYAVRPDDISADSHEGFQRPGNEDSFACCTRPDGSSTMALVADGIGGQSNGALASSMCAKSMIKAWRLFSRIENPSESMTEAFLYTEIEKTNRKIFEYSHREQDFGTMGTTIAGLFFLRKKIIAFHAGDSRIYRLRGNMLERMTRDHSIVGAMIEKGLLTVEEAKRHPMAHVISKSVGASPVADPEIQLFDRKPGDRYILCSDGLNLHVPDDEIQKMLSEVYEPSQAVKSLMTASLRKGGFDNITIICIFA